MTNNSECILTKCKDDYDYDDDDYDDLKYSEIDLQLHTFKRILI